MPKEPRDNFLEDGSGSIEDLSSGAVANAARLRERLRLNRAVGKASLLSADAEQIVLQRIVQGDDMLPFYVLELGARLGRAVCKIAFDDEADGTGFLIGPSLLVTNHHVLPDVARARQASCIFDFQLNLDRKPQETVTYRLDPDALFATSPSKDGLDYTFVRIDPTAGARYAPIAASRGSFTSLAGEFANIVQHPLGKMKRVAMRDNRILTDSGVTIRYLADADRGSSGSPVFNSDWQLIALHHAGATLSPQKVAELQAAYPGIKIGDSINEGIKFSAIAADLERLAQGREGAAAREVLRAFRDTDTLLGYFGGLGRPTAGGTAAEQVLTTYSGDAHDIDVGFWNIEWFGTRYRDKVDVVAKLIADLTLDIYVLSDIAGDAIRHLAEHLDARYGLAFDFATAEVDVPSGRPTTVVLWNKLTVARIEADWPEEVRSWFGVNLRNLRGDRSEAVTGKVFDRYPARFRFHALQREGVGEAFDFNLVPLHLPALTEGAFRREEGVKILSLAIAETIAKETPEDWVVGGDFNAALLARQVSTLSKAVLPLGAEDEEGGAIAYLKGERSLIDHLFISPNLTKSYGKRDYLVPAADGVTPDRVRDITDHRPVFVRLSLTSQVRNEVRIGALPEGLEAALRRLAA